METHDANTALNQTTHPTYNDYFIIIISLMTISLLKTILIIKLYSNKLSNLKFGHLNINNIRHKFLLWLRL